MKERILAIAADLFALHGYRGATIRDICAHANCSVGAIYDHFINKRDLYRKAFRHRARQIEPELARAARLTSSKLRDRAFVSACMHHQSFLKQLVVDDIEHSGETARFFERLQKKLALPLGRAKHLEKAVRRAAGMLWLDTIRLGEAKWAVSSESMAWVEAFVQREWPSSPDGPLPMAA